MIETEVLQKTKELIETRGWAQYAGETADGRLCLSQAIHVAGTELGDTPATHTKCMAGRDAVQKRLNNISNRTREYNSITSWNDTGGRTKEEVVNLLEEVISEPV